MPQVKAGDISMEYYVEGQGPPLLMIMGFLGQASSWGEPFLERLRSHFTTIAFSNRGCGLSEIDAAPVTIRLMADDTARLLQALDIERAHVLGISMGGMIAQELVLNHAERVQGLVLGCTNCGPAHSIQSPPESMIKMTQTMNVPPEQRARVFWEMTVTPEFVDRESAFLDAILARMLEQPTPWAVFGRQFAAIQGHDTYDRLPQVKAPTLILHGDRDALVPVGNAGILQERIQGSRARIIPGAGHCFFWEKPGESGEAVVEFLASVPAPA